MAEWREEFWESTVTGVSRHESRSGNFRCYLPDPLTGRTAPMNAALGRRLAAVERRVRAVDGPGAEVRSSVSRFLLRSEAIASSRIEGVAPSARQVALAELGRSEEVRGVSEQARLVANNLTVVQEATGRLAQSEVVSAADLESLQAALLADEPHLHGLRTSQNWIGGAQHNPIDADFVPPPPGEVPRLVADLLDYLSGATDSPLVQAAAVHAQFETIHPFRDGNGRVGRALVHTVLARRGLTTTAVLPISLVLATRREQYVAGLTSYRYVGPPTGEAAAAAQRAWLSVFLDAADAAVTQSRAIVTEIGEVRGRWWSRLERHRADQGRTRALRADSTSARTLELLPGAPVLTARTVAGVLDVSTTAAHLALEELRGAGVLSSRTIRQGVRAYLADELLDLLTLAERRLASTRFDTREAPPNRVAPARPLG